MNGLKEDKEKKIELKFIRSYHFSEKWNFNV